MPRIKKKSVCICKCMTVLSDNDDSDSETVDNLATADQPDSEDAIAQETVEMNKEAFQEGHACLYTLIEWIREIPCFY